jgi:hypothetical protein
MQFQTRMQSHGLAQAGRHGNLTPLGDDGFIHGGNLSCESIMSMVRSGIRGWKRLRIENWGLRGLGIERIEDFVFLK